jgi:hypothetical protein
MVGIEDVLLNSVDAEAVVLCKVSMRMRNSWEPEMKYTYISVEVTDEAPPVGYVTSVETLEPTSELVTSVATVKTLAELAVSIETELPTGAGMS